MDINAPVFHIGYHKTATTWLQKLVWPRATSHRLVRRRIARQALLAPYGLEFDPARARELLEMEGDGRPILVSEENLSGYPHTSGLHGLMGPEIARRIKATYPNARIIISIRSQYGTIRSCYSQYIKGGGTASLHEYLYHNSMKKASSHNFKNPLFKMEFYNYDKLISYYESMFGFDDITIIMQEDILSDYDNFMGKIGSLIKLSPPEDTVVESRLNTSYSDRALRIGRFLNLFRSGWVAQKRTILAFDLLDRSAETILAWITRIAPGHASPADPLHPLHDAIRCAYSEGNNNLEKRWNLPLAERGYPV